VVACVWYMQSEGLVQVFCVIALLYVGGLKRSGLVVSYHSMALFILFKQTNIVCSVYSFNRKWTIRIF